MSMQHLDLQVAEQALAWLNQGNTVWLCTVLSTFGSSPRAPGCMMAALGSGCHIGSISGGCVEEDFLERLVNGCFTQNVEVLRYGCGGANGARVSLPCGGSLDVLVERLLAEPSNQAHLEVLLSSLHGQRSLVRNVDIGSGQRTLHEDLGVGPRVFRSIELGTVKIRVGPAARLIIAGVSPVSKICAEFAHTLGFEVIVCDPREEAQGAFDVPGVEFRQILPSLVIASSGICHAATAVVALTHDPRIDDLAMMEAVKTPAFYIGVMGSQRTSVVRGERLRRSGGLSEQEVDRIHMPIGLAIGSKTPAEIAMAVMADIIRVQRGRSRDAL
ncbi:XdhC family protein [Microbulbifer sp. ALW1]|uniref:XdhC family protein n=1 Tax=Microbulbifer sp. (strain ALW1) TaxID=1516059 RepID=UPI0019121D22|nr:XdhC family protein [Microbulbifer sp. ALW1]